MIGRILRWLVIDYLPKRNLDSWIFSSNPFVKNKKQKIHITNSPINTLPKPRFERQPNFAVGGLAPNDGNKAYKSRLPLLPKLIQKKHLKLPWIFVPPLKLTVRTKKWMVGILINTFVSLWGAFRPIFRHENVSFREGILLRDVIPERCPTSSLTSSLKASTKGLKAAANNGNDNFFDTGTWPSFSKTSYQKA